MICSHPSIIPTEEEIKDSIRFMRERYGTCGVSVEPHPLTSTEQIFFDSIDPFEPCLIRQGHGRRLSRSESAAMLVPHCISMAT